MGPFIEMTPIKEGDSVKVNNEKVVNLNKKRFVYQSIHKLRQRCAAAAAASAQISGALPARSLPCRCRVGRILHDPLWREK